MHRERARLSLSDAGVDNIRLGRADAEVQCPQRVDSDHTSPPEAAVRRPDGPLCRSNELTGIANVGYPAAHISVRPVQPAS